MSRQDQIIQYVAAHPRCTRQNLANALNVCYVYVSTKVAQLAKDGVVLQERAARHTDGRGRQPYLLTINPNSNEGKIPNV